MSLIWTTKTLPDGTEIFYSDSGSPNDSGNYSTLLIIHGSGYNGHGFQRMQAAGIKQNIRTFTINRPEYAGSTKYTDAQIQEIVEGRKVFLDRFQLQLAHLLNLIISEAKVPQFDKSKKTGGIVIMGWSLGASFGLTLLGDPDIIPRELYNVIEPEVTDLILYDPPHVSLGYPASAEFDKFTIWNQPGKSEAMIYDEFITWVSSYYDHKDTNSVDIEKLDMRSRGDMCTLDHMSQEEIDLAFDGVAAGRADLPMFAPPMQRTLAKLRIAALLDENLARTFFPNVKISLIQGLRTQWCSIIGRNFLRKDYEGATSVRPIRFVEIPSGNHFLHYDATDALVTSVVQLIHS